MSRCEDAAVAVRLAVGVVLGLVVLWGAALVVLWRYRPAGVSAPDALRLLPDLLGLVGRLASDRTLARGVRVRLWLLLAYLAAPIDLVPDFIPVIGYADDIIVVALVLRSVIRA